MSEFQTSPDRVRILVTKLYRLRINDLWIAKHLNVSNYRQPDRSEFTSRSVRRLRMNYGIICTRYPFF